MMNKICHFFIGLILLITFWGFLIPALPAYAAEGGSCGEELTWEISDQTLIISGSGKMMEYSDGAFPGWYGRREEIRSISLPSGLTSISDFAFLGCEKVTDVSIPDSVTEIGDYAFAQCTSLLYADFGTGVEHIGEGTFQECESLTMVSFPPSLTEIDSKAFYRCYGLQTLTVPVTVTDMGSSVFAYCSRLVRATVNAPLEVLPEWTFYGCQSLTDVSLAPSISGIGDYAFGLCENLNGIYTQEGNTDTAYELDKSMSKGEGISQEGLVATYEMPESSVVAQSDDEVYSEKRITQADGTVISVIKETGADGGKATCISAVVNESEDWTHISHSVAETLENENGKQVTVEIQLLDNVVEASYLELFAGKSVILKLTTTNGVIWKINMAEMSEKSFSGKYDLSVDISAAKPEETEIVSQEAFYMKFSDAIDFNAEIGVKTGKMHDLATLYQKDGTEYEIIDTMVVDSEGLAWYSLASADKRTTYMIAINADGITLEESIIPDTMEEAYGIDEEATLMDAEGTQYRVTGRTSKWGITGRQFASYVAVFMIATVLVVGFVMITGNIIRRSGEKYERMAEEEALKEQEEEEALRMEIMRELLGEDTKHE